MEKKQSSMATSSRAASQVPHSSRSSSMGSSRSSRVSMRRSDSHRKGGSKAMGASNDHERDGFQILDPVSLSNRTPQPLHAAHGSKSTAVGGHERIRANTSSVATSRIGDGSESGRTSPVGSEVSDWERMSSFSLTKSDHNAPASATATEADSVPGSPFSVSETASEVSDTEHTKDDVGDGAGAVSSPHGRATAGNDDVASRDGAKSRTTPDDVVFLDTVVTVSLSETDTVYLLDIPAEAVGQDNQALAAAVKERNKRYAALLQSKQGNDRYSDRSMQTISNARRAKEVQLDCTPAVEEGVLATVYDIYDTMEATVAGQVDVETQAAAVAEDRGNVGANGDKGAVGAAAPEADDAEGDDDDQDFDAGDDNAVVTLFTRNPGESGNDDDGKPDAWSRPLDPSLATSPALQHALTLVERVVLANTQEDKLVVYEDAFVDAAEEASLMTKILSSLKSEEGRDSESAGDEKTEREGEPKTLFGLSSRFDDEDDYEAEGSKNADGDFGEDGQGLQNNDFAPTAEVDHETISGTDADKCFLLFRFTPPQSATSPASPSVPSPAPPTVAVTAGSAGAAHSAPSPSASVHAAATPGVLSQQKGLSASTLRHGLEGITAIAFNPRNKNLMAIGYGNHIAVYNRKNLAYPERLYKLQGQVCSLAFSPFNGSQLAIGLHDGSVLLYDVRTTHGLLFESVRNHGKHSDPVWDLSFRGEGRLVSVSGDGRVSEWTTKKGLECTDLMKLKRISGGAAAQRRGAIKSDAFIARHSGGLSISFSPADPNIYVVGTEDGDVFKCSCSYSEQYLEYYGYHSNPVFRVRYNSLNPSFFASCSGDWSFSVWHADRPTKPLLSVKNDQEAVVDCMWHPRFETILATVGVSGRLNVWNFAVSVIDPVVCIKFSKRGLQCVSWVPGQKEHSAIVLGDALGHVSVYKLRLGDWSHAKLDTVL